MRLNKTGIDLRRDIALQSIKRLAPAELECLLGLGDSGGTHPLEGHPPCQEDIIVSFI